MELPNYRMPSVRTTLQLMWDKAKDFLHRAFTVIFVASLVIWFLQTFDTRINPVSDNSQSLLAALGGLLAPLFAPLGFADWRVCTSLIAGFMAKEAVVSTLGVLTGGAALSTLFSVRSAAAFLVFTLLYTPCVRRSRRSGGSLTRCGKRSASWCFSACSPGDSARRSTRSHCLFSEMKGIVCP